MQFNYISKKAISISIVVLAVAMMVATVLEKAGLSDEAFSLVYHSPAFIALWGIVAILGAIQLIRKRTHRRPAVFCIHMAFALILAGALTTHLTSEESKLHLRVGETAEVHGNEIVLEDFKVVRSAGGAPIDYVSTVNTADGKVEIAMNRILKKRGCRIFQSGYDEDEAGAWFSVSYDPWGTGISYAGYWLLFASLLLFFFDGKSRFREALRRYRKHGAVAAAVLCCLFSGDLEAKTAPKVLPKDVAEEFGKLYVNYNGRICQVQTMARDYVMKVYGKPSVNGYSAEQVFTGWMYWYDSWKGVPVKCKRKERGGAKEAEKQQIVTDIAGGRDLKIFPVCRPGNDSGETELVWYAAASRLPFDMDSAEWTFIREVNNLVGEYAFEGDWEAIRKVYIKIGEYQLKAVDKFGKNVLPTSSKVKAERIYNSIGRPFIAAMASVTAGLILFILMSLGLMERKRLLNLICHIVAGAAFLYLSAVLGLRWFVSGHVPMSSGYEMMMIIAWLGFLLTALLGLRLNLMHCFGFIVSGFAMLVASLGQASPQIGTLMPVLASPLLSVHVSCMMLSYTLLGLLAMNGLLGLVQGRKSADAAQESVDRGILILYPALFFLTAGTFIGAIWANVSWGNYWSWDPKETWALITVLVYSAAVHSRSLKVFEKPAVFNAFCVIAFICVLITYFGVNFFLGGAHSYA